MRVNNLQNGTILSLQNLLSADKLQHYKNYYWIHKTLKRTPAMRAGLTKTIWELKDLINFNGE